MPQNPYHERDEALARELERHLANLPAALSYIGPPVGPERVAVVYQHKRQLTFDRWWYGIRSANLTMQPAGTPTSALILEADAGARELDISATDATQAAINLFELGNPVQGGVVAPGIDTGGADYPPGFNLQPIGGANDGELDLGFSMIKVPVLVTRRFIGAQVNQLRWTFYLQNGHGHRCS